jgi:hypothetical protein
MVQLGGGIHGCGRGKKKLLVVSTNNLLNLKSNTMKNTLQR